MWKSRLRGAQMKKGWLESPRCEGDNQNAIVLPVVCAPV